MAAKSETYAMRHIGSPVFMRIPSKANLFLPGSSLFLKAKLQIFGAEFGDFDGKLQTSPVFPLVIR